MALFLDTTIQYKRFHCHSHEKKQINEICHNAKLLCSRYVLMEYKRGLVRGFLLFYTYIKEEKTFDDAYARFSELYSGRQKSIILIITSKLMAIKCIAEDKNQLLRRLERYIDWELVDKFENNVKYITNIISCKLANADATVGYTDFIKQLSCRREDNNCNIEYFMKQNLRHLKRLYLKSQKEDPKDEFFKIGTLCKEIIDDFKKSKGNNCKILGDTIIALECPRRDILLTSDTIFEKITKVFKKRLKLLA